MRKIEIALSQSRNSIPAPLTIHAASRPESLRNKPATRHTNRSNWLLAWAIVVCGFVFSTTCLADEFQLSLDGGSVITVEVSGQTIDWTSVMENGDMTKKSIPFSDVKQLLLSSAPASKQVAKIRRYLSMLGGNNYLEREEAEKNLSDPAVGGRFKSLIKLRANEGSLESRYRVKRILQRLNNEEELSNNEFDQLTLKDGSVFEGDAGDLEIRYDFRGNQSTMKRDQLRLISTPTKLPALASAAKNIEVQMFHQHVTVDDQDKKVPHFYRDDQVIVDFDNAPNGATLKRNAKINDTFTPFGVRFDTGQTGYMGISGYPFRFGDLPVAGNSICVFQTIGAYPKRFKGITEIRFCLPNQANVPAGVMEVGLFIARVNHSRDFMVEAYNADGEILAAVESTNQSCVFAGVKANQPITKVRILSNPYLFRIDRAIDIDYGMDSICFSPPVPIPSPLDSQPGVIRLKNGDLLKSIGLSDEETDEANASPALNAKLFDTLRIVNDDSVSIQVSKNERMTLKLDELRSIRFANELDGALGKNKRLKIGAAVGRPDKWMAILKDRSTISVQPGAKLTSKMFNLNLNLEDLAGLKVARNPTRYPASGDFDKAKNVLVFPTCRIATNNLKFTNSGFEWQASDPKIQQPVQIGDEEEDDDQDPTPNFTSIQYAKGSPESTPTVWLAPPKALAAGTGKLRLTDGQRLTLGSESGFQITRLENRAVVISIADQEIKIPIEKVHSIDFPE